MKRQLQPNFIYLFFILLSFTTIDQLHSQTIRHEINFESIPNGDLSDSLIIDNQYLESNGVSFVLEDGTFPTIAKVGWPMTAFSTSFGADTILTDYGIGTYFLTDDGVLQGITISPLIMSFTSPVDSVSGAILDIDFGEVFTIQALDDLDNILHEIVIADGDPNTGDGIATEWGFSRTITDVHSIKISGERNTPGAFGLGFDNLVYYQLDETNSTQDRLNDQISIYPNPSTGNITIASSQEKTITSIELYDINGMKLDHRILSNNHETNIHCNYNGTVIVRILIDDSVIIKKFILN